MPESNSSDFPRRQLAAILFADMAGFTALMEADEKAAWQLRERMRETLEANLRRYSGRVVNYYGDGMLCLFAGAGDAVRCGMETQHTLSSGTAVRVRMGIHAGEVCLDDGGVYGDCVNLASRIQAMSVPGGLLISDKVYDEIKNQRDINTHALGAFQLKHITRQVHVFAVTNGGLPVPDELVPVPDESAGTIAVLPFVNMSTDPDNEYFSDGVSEEILNALSQMEGLRVCARSSSFAFKGQTADVREVGRTLGVGMLLEGSVRRSGNRVRVTAQLVNAADGYRVWSETYDGDIGDIFSVQDAISSRIVNRLAENSPRTASGPGDVASCASRNYVPDLAAYQLFLKGRFHFNKSHPEDIQRAIPEFEAALALDPGFAQAYCMLAYCYSFLGSSGHMPFSEAFGKAMDYTLKALDIDPNHAESHLSLATVRFFQQWDFEGAEQSLNRARQLGLNSSMLHHLHGMILVAMGRFDEAVARMEEALRLEPLSLRMMCSLADAFAFGSRFDEAIEMYDKVLALDPTFRRAVEGKGQAYMAQGDLATAIPLLEEYHRLVGHPLKGLSSLGHAYALNGDREKALDCLARTRQRELEEPGVTVDSEYGFIYAGLQEYEKAYQHFERLYERRMGVACMGMIYCIRYPLMTEFKQDPRFARFFRQLGPHPD